MPRNNHVFVIGDITGDIYFDIFELSQKSLPFLRLMLMVPGTEGYKTVKGLRVVAYSTLAELSYGYVQLGTRVAVVGHLQSRVRGREFILELVAEEIQFLRNADWERGEKGRLDLVAQGKMKPSYLELAPDLDEAGLQPFAVPEPEECIERD